MGFKTSCLGKIIQSEGDKMACFIIAEAGVNHNGKVELAFKLCDAAKKAGADSVKFQIFDAKKLVCRNAKKAEYQEKNDSSSKTQLEMLNKLSLTNDEFRLIAEHCNDIGIKFMATAFDEDSVDFLYSLGVEVIKVPSGEITNLPYLEKISRLWKTIIMSTGMATIDEIKMAFKVLSSNGAKVTVLHCTTEYPAPFETVNLKAMYTIGNELGIPYGYSDHTVGIEVPVAAVALGASVIEKHFTLDRNMEGPDHIASIEPDELMMMVNSIKNVEMALGKDEKIVNECEMKNRLVARKSIVAKCAIKKGETLSINNLTTKRPGSGISPMRWYEILGTKAIRDFDEDELIEI